MTREDINDIINAICPNDEDYEKPCISPKYLRQELEQLALDQRQWNEDPTTKNDLGVDVLDKIRAEIETKYGQCQLIEYIVQYDGICTGTKDIGDIADILQIIDKYKGESEG